MWLLIKTAWRNLFRQRRRTAITVSAMALSLTVAIPTYGLILGIRSEVIKGITGMELGHVQIHDPAYPEGRALQSTLRRPDRLLKEIRALPGVAAAAPRAKGFGLLAYDRQVRIALHPLPLSHPARREGAVRFGRAINVEGPWRKDVALACEALVHRQAAQRHAVAVGTVLAPQAAQAGGACERVRIVGLLRKPLGPGAGTDRLVLGLAAADVKRAFGNKVRGVAILRNASSVALFGVDPSHERRVTFMAKKVLKGSYLSDTAKNEMVVGHRLARIMRLKVGVRIFLQAATLDYTSGAYYQTFRVVGIYKTGIDNIDRSRVFLHLKDAQRVMGLGRRAHEIAIKAREPKKLGPLVKALKERAARVRLRASTRDEGKRAGSVALPAPVFILDRDNAKIDLLIPHDLQQRLRDLKGLQTLGKRVYGQTRVRRATPLKAEVQLLESTELRALLKADPTGDPCAVYLPAAVAARFKVKQGQPLLTAEGAQGEEGCARFVVAGTYSAEAKVEGLPRLLAPKLPARPDDEEGLEPGPVTLLFAEKPQVLRLVGVEPGVERRISKLHQKVAKGRYLKDREDEQEWPVLASAAAAKKLGVAVGATLLLRTRDVDQREGWRAARLVGVLKDWDANLPELVLPYFLAQQVDAPRLNARAHEMVLLPGAKVSAAALAQRATEQLRPLVRPWHVIVPLMKEIAQMQDMVMSVLLFIIMAIAAMTVMNTMLMAVFERTREFGVLKSLGMRPRQVFGLIVVETVFIATIAAALGGGLGYALDHYFAVEGLDMRSLTEGFSAYGTFIDPVWRAVISLQGILMPIFITLFICFVVSFYPALRAGRLKPVDALRDHR